jgi:hypothetical protein
MHRVQQRTQAIALSVALVLSGILPGAAAAQEPDQDREGTAVPEPTAPPDSTADPDFDPGAKTDLPFGLDLRTGGGDDDAGDGAPVDQEPVSDPDAPTLGEPAPTDTPETLAVETPTAPAETPPPDPAPVLPPPTSAVPAPPPPETQPTTDRRAKRSAERARKRDQARQQPAPLRVTIPAAAVAAPAPTTAPAPVAVADEQPPAADSGPPARSSDDSYTVRRGESLWTIASDLLGSDAAVAEIAAESNRLYALNRDRIGPDPDYLIAGTVLRLR